MAIAVLPDTSKYLGRIRFTSKDYQSLRDEMVGRIETICVDSQGNPKWTDYNPSDIGITLLELMAGVGTNILWHLDNAANESFLANARQRKNVQALTKLIGYRMSHVQSSTATVTLSRSTPWPFDIKINKFLTISTSDPALNFAVSQDYTWQAGDLSIDVDVKQGTLVEEMFLSNGGPNEIIPLSDLKFGQNTADVQVNSVQWDEVNSFISSTGADFHYTTVTDHNDITYVIFGDGNFGAAPNIGSSVRVRYLKSDGDDGNVGSNTINGISGVIRDITNAVVSGISATNNALSPVIKATNNETFNIVAPDTFMRIRLTVNGVVQPDQTISLTPGIGLTAASVASDISSLATNILSRDVSGKVELFLLGTGITNRIELLPVLNDVYGVIGFSRGSTSGSSGSATGGAEKEGTDTAKRQAPASLQALSRVVTKFDYQAKMNEWPGVAKSQAWGEQEQYPPNYNLFNRVQFTFMPEGGGSPSGALVTEVVNMLEEMKVITTKLEYIPPVFIDTDIQIVLYLNPGFSGANTRNEVIEGIYQILDENNREFQEDVRYTQIVWLIQDVLGVHHANVLLNGLSNVDIIVNLGEFAVLNSLTVNVVPYGTWQE